MIFIDVLLLCRSLRPVWQGSGCIAASETVAKFVFPGKSVASRAVCIRRWAKFYLLKNRVPVSRQGKHGKTSSLIDNEVVRSKANLFFRSLPAGERTCRRFVDWVNDTLLPSLPDGTVGSKISERTACRWQKLHISCTHLVSVSGEIMNIKFKVDFGHVRHLC